MMKFIQCYLKAIIAAESSPMIILAHTCIRIKVSLKLEMEMAKIVTGKIFI